MSEQELASKPATETAKRTAPAPGQHRAGHGGGATAVLQLQRSVGNAATARLLGGGTAGAGVIRRKGTTDTTTVDHDAFGSTTTKVKGAHVGHRGGRDDSSDTFDGTTTTSSSVKEEGFAGASRAVTTISRATETEITHAVEALARAGAFGESSRKAAVQRGALRAEAEGSAKGFVGAEAQFKGSVTVSPDLYNALVAVMEASAKVGAGGELKGSLTAALGPLSASIGGQLTAFAGAMAKVNAKLDVGLTHLYAEAAAEAMAGAEGSAKAEVKVKLGDAEASGAIEGTALAGAKVAAGGTFKIDLTGVELAGKAEAFAGVKADVTATGSAAYKGRQLFKASGTVGVSAGVGGKAEGGFMFRGGKLHIKGELAGALGIGAKAGFELEVDFYAIALAIEEAIVEAFLRKKEEINRSSPAVERIPIIDQAKAAQTHQLGYVTYLKDFNAYNAKKAKQGESGIKRERIQEILDKRWHANKDNWQFLEFDEGIMDAAKDAFGAKLKYMLVQSGQIRAFEVERTDAQKAHAAKQRKKAGLKF